MPPLVYIVDDDPSVRDSLKLVFEFSGYDVMTFDSASDFFSRAVLDGADCAIVDVNLPGESGFELLSRLRSQGAGIPVILVSGRATPAMRAKAGLVNAPFYEKPVPPGDLLSVVAQVVAGAQPAP